MSQNIKFSLIADSQLGITNDLLNQKNSDWENDKLSFQKCISQINQKHHTHLKSNQLMADQENSTNSATYSSSFTNLGFNFCCVLGDLVHSFPNSNSGQADFIDTSSKTYQNNRLQVQDFKTILNSLDSTIIPYVISGNHDLGQIPIPDSKLLFNSDYNLSTDYYDFKIFNFHFVCLNSQPFKAGLKGEYSQQLGWLEQVLQTTTLLVTIGNRFY